MTRVLRHQPESEQDQVQREVERMLRLVLHEIRQPVAAIFALAEAARGLPEVSPELCGYLDRIVAQAEEVAGAASDVLAAEEHRTDAETGPADADEIVDSVLEAYRLTWSGTLARRGDRGSSPVVGGRAAVRRCLVNVVDNAVRAAGPSGTVTVLVRRGAEDVTITVEDDGPGLGRGPRGTGLGMEATRQALAAMGGHLSAGVATSTGGGRVVLVLPGGVAGRRRSDRSVHALRGDRSA